MQLFEQPQQVYHGTYYKYKKNEAINQYEVKVAEWESMKRQEENSNGGQ